MKLLTKTLFASLVMLAISGYAKGNHASVNSRPLSTEMQEEMDLQRLTEYEQNAEFLEGDATDLSVLIIPIKTHHLASLSSNHLNSTANTMSSFHYHWIEELSNSTIRIEDGSSWTFNAGDAHVLRSWQNEDAVVITPKVRVPLIGSRYAYLMTNKNQETAVEVNLTEGPIVHGNHTFWIVAKDINLGRLHLMNAQGDHSIWEIPDMDKGFFEKWKVNDTIIVGENDNWLWWFSDYRNILINTDMDHNIRAKQVSSKPNLRAVG